MCNRCVSPTEAEIERAWHVGRKQPGRWWEEIVLPAKAAWAFIRQGEGGRQLVAGQWGLIPPLARTPQLKYSTHNARSEELAGKPSYRQPWARGQRYIIPARSFDEPCWETGRNVLVALLLSRRPQP
ncbi:MAG: SOS response-associated peptidase family protein [Ottowia sp.]